MLLQVGASNALELELQEVGSHGCWEPHMDPTQEQCMFLNAETSLQPLLLILKGTSTVTSRKCALVCTPTSSEPLPYFLAAILTAVRRVSEQF